MQNKVEINTMVNSFNCQTILPVEITGSFLTDISRFTKDYFTYLANTKSKDIIFKRFELFDEPFRTLEDLGVYYDNSRERIRQIQNHHLNTMIKILSGDNINKNKKEYKINDGLLQNFITFKKLILEETLLNESKIYDICQIKNIIIHSKQEKNILFFLLILIGCKKYQYDNIEYFIVNNKINYQTQNYTCKQMYQLLLTKIDPINLFDLVVYIKRKNKKVDITYIKNAINLLTDIEKITTKDSTFYQLKFTKLKSLSDWAYRILLENQEIMNYKTFWREINHRLVKEDMTLKSCTNSLKNQLVSDDKFTPVGKTGNWGLTIWKFNASTIIELIIKALHYYNRPSTIKEINEYITNLRPQIKISSIYSIISYNKDKFIITKSKTIVLTEWGNNYQQSDFEKQATRQSSMNDFCKTLYKINIKYPNKEFTIYELKKILENYDINYSTAYCNTKFNKCPMLKKTIKKENRYKSYFSIDANYKIKEMKRNNKLEILKNKIIQFINSSKSPTLKLNDVIKHLSKSGEIKTNIYSVISKNPNIFYKYKIENTYFIELKNKQTLEAIKEDKKNEILKIKNGENNLVEFKSTLRWDINKGQINKTMEFMVIKAISAFLNSQGGTLYIGISDDGTIIGLEKDYSTFKKKNRDGFLLYFNDLLIKYFSKTIFTYIEHNIEEESGKDYAIIKIKKSPKPIFITENKEKLFFIRFSASVQKLEIDEASTYILSNWK